MKYLKIKFKIRSKCCSKESVTPKKDFLCSKCKLELAEAQSDAKASMDVDTPVTNEQNVEFSNAQDVVGLEIAPSMEDSTFLESSTVGSDLSEFLSRPVEIYSTSVAVGIDYAGIELFPWNLFLQTTSIQSKLANYKLFNGTLNIKILVNGTKFHYGRFYAGVRPCEIDNNTTNKSFTYSAGINNYYDSSGAGTYTGNPLVTLYTSRPGVFIDPGSSQSSLITWPFIYHKDNIDLIEVDEPKRLGALELFQLNQLGCNTSGDSNVTISVLAWMTDVQLNGITAGVQGSDLMSDLPECQSGIKTKKNNSKNKGNEPKRKNESTKKPAKKSTGPVLGGNTAGDKDEYNTDGPVSGPASAVTRAAEAVSTALGDVPVIGKLAKATAIVARGVWGIASLFGWSNPAILDKPELVVEKPLGNTVNCSGNDPVSRLTVDPKQELTVDPRSCGFGGEDEMSIPYIIKREAFVGKFEWNSTSTFSSGILCTMDVSPSLHPIYTDGGTFGRCYTPLAFVSAPFTYWTGALRFRFQIVASQMARGRLKLQYDPCITGDYDNATTAINTRFTHILDLEEERDNTFEVNWTQPEKFKQTGYAVGGNSVFRKADTAALVGSTLRSNGTLIVSVMNQLTTPDDAGVEVNVFVSGGDSFQLRGPSSTMGYNAFVRDDKVTGPPSLPQVQGSLLMVDLPECQSDDVTSQENMPEQDTEYVLNGDYKSHNPDTDLVYFGEVIASIRTLMKRYTPHRLLGLPPKGTDDDDLVMVSWIQRDFPNGPGPSYSSSLGSELTRLTGLVNYNLCVMTYARYFAQAYVGWRGSHRWKVSPYIKTPTNSSLCFASRYPVSEGTSESVVAEALVNIDEQVSVSAQNFASSDAIRAMHAGTHLSNTNNQGNLLYEVPFQSQYRFMYNTHSDGVTEQFTDCNHRISYAVFESTDMRNACATFHATGEDFLLCGFIGCPPVFTSDVGTVSPALAGPP